MPKFSAFTPYGLLRYSSNPSRAKRIYDALVLAHKDPETGQFAFDCTPGTHIEASIYARAKAYAVAEGAAERLDNQDDPHKCYDARRGLEKQYGVRLPRQTSMAERRDELEYRMSRNRGSVSEHIIEGLTRIFGGDFIAYHPITTTESVKWPASPGSGPGTFPKATVPAKKVRILDPIASLNPQEVSYENWSPVDAEVQIAKGDILCVGAEDLVTAEKVTVTAASGTGTSRVFTAQFNQAHEPNSSATTGPVPIWWSTKRLALVVVAAASASNPILRRKAYEFLRRASRACTLVEIVQPTTPGATTTGPYLLAQSPLGAVPVGEFDI